MSAMAATIHTDGAARGNPGPGAYAFVIVPDGGTPIEDKGALGHTTNNVAEYTAMVRALERASQIGLRRVTVCSDSELMVKQMNGEYRVKNADLQSLYDEAQTLCRAFEKVSITHVRREQNRRADELCNEVLDGGVKPAARASKSAPRVSVDRADAVRADAVACLRAAAIAWARGQAESPRPEDVWEQLWSVLEEHGAVRMAK